MKYPFKNTHLDKYKNSLNPGSYYVVTVRNPTFSFGEKILVREDDLAFWKEATYMDYGEFPDMVKTDIGQFNQFRPLELQKTDFPPTDLFLVWIEDNKITHCYKPEKSPQQIIDKDGQDIIIYESKIQKNDTIIKQYQIYLFAVDYEHAKERANQLLFNLLDKKTNNEEVDI